MKIFKIENTGTESLSLGDLELPEGFSLITPFPQEISAGGTENFHIQFNAEMTGESQGILRFSTNDKDENPYQFTIKAESYIEPQPNLELYENEVKILNYSTVNFSDTSIGMPVIKTFRIQNTGTEQLNLTLLKVPEGFALSSDFPEIIESGEETSFQIQLQGNASGIFEGIFSFDSNDLNQPYYSLNLKGTVRVLENIPPEITGQAPLSSGRRNITHDHFKRFRGK